MMCADDFSDDLDDWEVIIGCHQNRTSVPQPWRFSRYLVGINPVIYFVNLRPCTGLCATRPPPTMCFDVCVIFPSHRVWIDSGYIGDIGTTRLYLRTAKTFYRD